MDPSFDIERRSPVPTTVTDMNGVPADAHATVKEIVSLLSRALVLALGLAKAMVITSDAPRTRRIQNSVVNDITMLEEPSAQVDPDSAHGPGDSFVVEGGRDPRVNGNRYYSKHTAPHRMIELGGSSFTLPCIHACAHRFADL
jgi:hypothetical protein